jgi:hypothetical protein
MKNERSCDKQHFKPKTEMEYINEKEQSIASKRMKRIQESKSDIR